MTSTYEKLEETLLSGLGLEVKIVHTGGRFFVSESNEEGSNPVSIEELLSLFFAANKLPKQPKKTLMLDTELLGEEELKMLHEKLKAYDISNVLIKGSSPEEEQNKTPTRRAAGFSLRAVASTLSKKALSFAEDHFDRFITFHLRPRHAHSMTTWRADDFSPLSHWAIVLQGPICIEQDFTLETIRLYKNMFPGIKIVLSTWEHEHAAYIEHMIAPEDIETVYNSKPAYPGPTNINFQIVSARAGVERAKELGAQYVMKVRTDQRIYEKNALEFITNTLEYFPASARSGQTKRLAFVHGLPKYSPYQFADLCMGGHITDMLEYWQVEEVKKGEASAFFVSEVYLATSFLTKKKWQFTWDTEQLWEIYRECIVPIDWYMLDLYWFKYERHREHRDRITYTVATPRLDLLRFSEWFNLISNPSKEPPLHAPTLAFRGRVPLIKDQHHFSQ
ncbi:MAG: WavE lipopolysaccharide synthesis family protein [Patescibacteria group bacterium]